MTSLKQLPLIFLAAFVISGCGIYSFSGASICEECKTISIDYFQNNAAIVVPTLSQSFTEKLRDRFVNQTSLDLAAENGDLDLKGYIADYIITPVAPSSNETASLNRLTITVKVTFTNTKDAAQNYEKNFSRFTDFQSDINLSDIEEELIEEINEQLVDVIFNDAVANW